MTIAINFQMKVVEMVQEVKKMLETFATLRIT